jgi:hypothetical protein
MSTENNDGNYEVLWPRSPRQFKVRGLAPRLPTLAGKTIAQLWDYQYRGDEIFGWLGQELSARFPGVRFVHWSEFGPTRGDDERKVIASLPQRFHELGVDAVVSGIGA